MFSKCRSVSRPVQWAQGSNARVQDPIEHKLAWRFNGTSLLPKDEVRHKPDKVGIFLRSGVWDFSSSCSELVPQLTTEASALPKAVHPCGLGFRVCCSGL